MKIKSLILAFPVLCLACNNPSTPQDPASQVDASPIVARQVSGLKMLTTDYNYDQPCNLLGEEYIRGLFKVAETTELAETLGQDGCAFGWEGNTVTVSFGGSKPYASVYTAEYIFDKMYQGKKAEPVAAVSEMPDPNAIQTATSSEGGNQADALEETTANDKAEDSTKTGPMEDAMAGRGGVTAATPPLTAPSISLGNFEAVRNAGDKAVWDAPKSTMHVLYNNHIINVTVKTKGGAEARKEHALNLAEVLMEKIAENEYTKAL